MSLINDALKRARDVDRERSSTPTAPPLRPVEQAAQARPRPWWPILALVVVALGLSIWSFSRWAGTEPSASGDQLAIVAPETAVRLPDTAPITPHEEQVTPSNSSPPVPAAPATDSSPSPSIAPQSPDALPVPPADSMLELSTSPLPGNASPAEVLSPPPVETSPPLRLQSILFRTRNPAVVINGQFLHEGDSIEGARITKIEPERVTLEVHETNLVLSMPRY